MSTTLSRTAPSMPYLLQRRVTRNTRRQPITPPLCRLPAGVSSRMVSKLSRPSPPPLPREQQREFEELLRSVSATTSNEQVGPVAPDFEGDVNPKTGEEGGPKSEPVNRWGESEGDWSFKGRVSDF